MTTLLHLPTLRFLVIGFLLSTAACGPSAGTSDPTATDEPTESSLQPTVTMPAAISSPTPEDEEVDDPLFTSEDLPAIAAILPSIEEVAQIMEMNLIEQGETYPGPVLPFEHVDSEGFVQGVSTSYLGIGDEGFVMIDLAEYSTAEAAGEVYGQMELESNRFLDEGTMVFESVDGADAAQGVVFPPSEENEFTVTEIIFRSGQVVTVIGVFSHDEDGRHVQARLLAVEVVRKLNE
jgi:hypothetical protein